MHCDVPWFQLVSFPCSICESCENLIVNAVITCWDSMQTLYLVLPVSLFGQVLWRFVFLSQDHIQTTAGRSDDDVQDFKKQSMLQMIIITIYCSKDNEDFIQLLLNYYSPGNDFRLNMNYLIVLSLQHCYTVYVWGFSSPLFMPPPLKCGWIFVQGHSKVFFFFLLIAVIKFEWYFKDTKYSVSVTKQKKY